MGTSLHDKIWVAHIIKQYDAQQALIYIDRHLVQEVSSPLAFTGLNDRHVKFWRPNAHIAVADHAISTQLPRKAEKGSLSALQIERLEQNCREFDIPFIPVDDPRQGIVHVIGPELGFTLPGSTLVCGDSHTATHGAFGSLAFGIGTSECETVFATQSLRQTKQKNMRVNLSGKLPSGVTIKDAILALIARIGTAGGQGHAIEFAGAAVSSLSMEARMTLCNMVIEAGSRIGMIAPDGMTFEYLYGLPLAPKGRLWDDAVVYWKTLKTDPDAIFDREEALDLSSLEPYVSWGTTPADCLPVSGHVPEPQAEHNLAKRGKIFQSLDYMGLKPGTRIDEVAIDRVFIGSCTNGRLEDLQRSAKIVEGRTVAPNVSAMVVPGSGQVRAEAEALGLDIIFKKAGFEWRGAGCSMCVAMNDDRLAPGERCASTSNRNFEGRQGKGGRTHLMSPEMAAAAAVTGKITDVRRLMDGKNG